MADESASEDRNEEPTARRLQKARDDGEVARSSEVPAASVLIAGTAYIFYSAGDTASRLKALFAAGFIFDQGSVHDVTKLPAILAEHIMQSFIIIFPLLAVTAIAAIAASGLTGGYLFSLKSAAPKFSKLSPFSGLKRIFGFKAVAEMTKATIKIALVGAVIIWVVADNLEALMRLGEMGMEPALSSAADMTAHAALLISLSLILIAVCDAFYQRHEFNKRMRMSKQDIRDEMKDSEGRPEVRAQIRRRQREMSTSRMMDRIKEADVVITNPEHFAVALAYDPSKDGAPILLAKGIDTLAFRIIEEAKKSGVHTMPAPPLARALYFTTKINHPIPEELYYVVAKVIAYVFSLSSFQPGMGAIVRPKLEIPKAMRFDSNGQLEAGGLNS